MTPSQEINKIAQELLDCNPTLSIDGAILNGILVHLDRKDKSNKTDSFGQIPEKKTPGMIRITIEDSTSDDKERKLVLEVNQDADIYEWSNYINTLLLWLTFQQETIDEILKKEE